MRQALRYLLARRKGFKEYHPVWSTNKLAQFYVIDVVLRILENTMTHVRRLYSEFRRNERFVVSLKTVNKMNLALNSSE